VTLTPASRAAADVTFDRFDAAFLEDPYPVWAALRDRDPLHRTDSGSYVVTRYADVWLLLRDRRCGRAIPERLVRRMAGPGATTEAFLGALLNIEGEAHRRLRDLLFPAFAPRAIAQRRARVATIVDELFQAIDPQSTELIADIAGDLPILVIAEMLGIPREDTDVVTPWIHDLIDASMLFPTADALLRSDEANEAFARYFREVCSAPSRPPGVLADLAEAEKAGAVSGNELAVNATLMLFAGHETTTNAIGNAVLTLLEHPHALRRLREEPQLRPAAVDELVRFDSPIQTTMRWTERPIDVSGGRIEARRLVEVSLAAANRDPCRFSSPDEVVLDRHNNAHVAFGSGIHFCLGAHLARLTVAAVLERLLDDYAAIELAGQPVRRQSLWNRGLERLPLRLTPR
jgi:cytochrome P450